jgi:hypothetical protein
MSDKFSLRAGDLSLDANGAFVWNTLEGLFGRWIALNEPTLYGRNDGQLNFQDGSTDLQPQSASPRSSQLSSGEFRWDFLLIVSAEKRWRCHVENDGRLRMRLDEDHLIFATR